MSNPSPLIQQLQALGQTTAVRARWDLDARYPDPQPAESALLTALPAWLASAPQIQTSGIQVQLGEHIDPYLAYLMVNDAYEHGDIALIRRHLPALGNSAHAVVMGGGIGVIATAIAQQAQCAVTVYDANPALLPHIRQTATLNQVDLAPQWGAIASTGGGHLTLHVSQEFWASSSRPGTYKAVQAIEVPTVAFAEALVQAQIAFVDIEGGEANLFFDPLPTSLQHLFVEIHTPALGHATSASVMNRLWQHGFELIEFAGLTYYWRRCAR
jgi:hypothetical protein